MNIQQPSYYILQNKNTGEYLVGQGMWTKEFDLNVKQFSSIGHAKASAKKNCKDFYTGKFIPCVIAFVENNKITPILQLIDGNWIEIKQTIDCDNLIKEFRKLKDDIERWKDGKMEMDY